MIVTIRYLGKHGLLLSAFSVEFVLLDTPARTFRKVSGCLASGKSLVFGARVHRRNVRSGRIGVPARSLIEERYELIAVVRTGTTAAATTAAAAAAAAVPTMHIYGAARSKHTLEPWPLGRLIRRHGQASMPNREYRSLVSRALDRPADKDRATAISASRTCRVLVRSDPGRGGITTLNKRIHERAETREGKREKLLIAVIERKALAPY